MLGDMKREFVEERELRAIVAYLGVAEVSVHAVLPGFFRYEWPCGCEIVIESSRRQWDACPDHARPSSASLTA